MARKKKRARTQRREAQRKNAREQAKQSRDRLKLQALEPGGRADNPIVVASTSLIDGAIRELRCLSCGGGFLIDREQGGVSAGRVVRRVDLNCRQCARTRSVHFALKVLN